MTTIYKIPKDTTSHAHAINVFRTELDLVLRILAQKEDQRRAAFHRGTLKARAQSEGRQDGLLAAAEYIRNLIVESPDA